MPSLKPIQSRGMPTGRGGNRNPSTRYRSRLEVVGVGGGVPPAVKNAARAVSVRNNAVSSPRLAAVTSKTKKLAAVWGAVPIPA
jgi:hypothetical protein